MEEWRLFLSAWNASKEEGQRLEKIKNENMVVPPIVKSLIEHFINNDLNIIGLIVQDYLDPADPKPIILDHAKKIYGASSSMTLVLEKLRKATQGDVGF
jgi:hypothetical protein